MKKKNGLALKFIIIGFGNIMPKISTFLLLPFLTSILTKEEYGIYDLIIIMVTLLAPNIILQLPSATFRFLIDSKNNDEDRLIISSSYFPIFIIAIFSTIVIDLIMFKYGMILSLVISLYYFTSIFLFFYQQVARGKGRNDIYSFASALNALCMLILGYFVLSIFNNPLSILVGTMVLANIVAIVFIKISLKFHKFVSFHYFRKQNFQKQFKYSWAMVPNSLSMWFVNMADRIIISGIMGISQMAVYAVANKIPQIMTLVQNTFTMAWQEDASSTRSTLSKEKYFSKVFEVLICLSAAAFFVINAFLPILYSFMISSKYAEAYTHSVFIMLGMMFYVVASFYGGIYVSSLKVKNVAISTIYAALIKFLFLFLFIKKFGLFSASIGTMVSYFFLVVFRAIDTFKLQKIYYNYGFILLIVVLVSVSTFFTIKGSVVTVVAVNIVEFLIVVGVLAVFYIKARQSKSSK